MKVISTESRINKGSKQLLFLEVGEVAPISGFKAGKAGYYEDKAVLHYLSKRESDAKMYYSLTL